MTLYTTQEIEEITTNETISFDYTYNIRTITKNYLLGFEAIGYLKHLQSTYPFMHCWCEQRKQAIMLLLHKLILLDTKKGN